MKPSLTTFILLVLAAAPSAAATYEIAPDGSGDFPTIQEAIDHAAHGDSIVLHDGVFSWPGNMGIDFLGKAVSVLSASNDPSACVVDCLDLELSGFVFQSGETSASLLKGIGIIRGRPNAGGGIYCHSSSPTIENCAFSQTFTNYGGGIYCYAGSPTIKDCEFSLNTARHGGAILCEHGADPTITNCRFLDNLAFVTAGGIDFSYDTGGHVTDCLFVGNYGARGGAFNLGGNCNVSITSCTIYLNHATSSGAGGIYNGGNSHVACNQTIIVNSIDAPAIRCRDSSTAAMTCCDLFGNEGGDWEYGIVGQLGHDGNISHDPLFCDPDNRILSLSHDSPCTPLFNPSCGLIGSEPVACDSPVISVTDVPSDQGGRISISWAAFAQDAPGEPNPLDIYRVLRLVNDRWVVEYEVAATQQTSYSTTLDTDDVFTVGEAPPYSFYMIRGYTTDPVEIYESGPTYGYSIDNIPPPTPVFTMWDAPGARVLVWENPDIPDFRDMCLFRDRQSGFVPSEPFLCTTGEFYTETDLTYYCYRLAAVDIHGNLSAYSEESCCQYPTDVPVALAGIVLEPNHPNPFNPSTVISYSLPRATHVRLAVYALDGRLVSVLADEPQPADRHSITWHGRDDRGQAVSAGVYFFSVSADGARQTGKMTLLK